MAPSTGQRPTCASSPTAALVVAERRTGAIATSASAGPGRRPGVEALARIAPPAPVRSLREGTRAQAVRAVAHLLRPPRRKARRRPDGGHGRARRCSRAATASTSARARRADRPSAIGRDLDYRLTDGGARRLRDLGVDVDGALAGPRAPIRYCVDWSEQDHHLCGALGAAVAARLFELEWVARLPRTRAVRLTDDGRAGLARAATGWSSSNSAQRAGSSRAAPRRRPAPILDAP